jgi:hypothetical protein
MYRVQVLEAVRIARLEMAVEPCRATGRAAVQAVAAAPAVFDDRAALPYWPAQSEPLPTRLDERPNLYRARRAVAAYRRAMNE